MNDEVTIHAGCVAIGGQGVLLCGESGSGKSDLAIRLIDRGAILVSDDYTRLRCGGGQLLAAPPETIAGRIELRGVGIVERTHVADIPVVLAIDLGAPPERLPDAVSREWLGLSIPVIALNALEASAPIKVEAALALHGLKSLG